METIIRLFRVLFGVSLLLITFLWMSKIPEEFDHEPLFAFLSLFFAATVVVIEWFHKRYIRNKKKEIEVLNEELKNEKYSTSMALAHGYFHNFISPVISSLREKHNRGKKKTEVLLFIYLPEKLDELFPGSIKSFKLDMKDLELIESTVQLPQDKARSRDILTVSKTKAGRPIYFDFPNTLLSLKPLVDYKTVSEKDSFTQEQQQELGRDYIEKFVFQLKKLVTDNGLGQYVRYTDSSMKEVKELV